MGLAELETGGGGGIVPTTGDDIIEGTMGITVADGSLDGFSEATLGGRLLGF